MARLDPDAASKKWANRLSGATEDIARGVGDVTDSPTAKAAAKRTKYLANVAAAADKWEKRLKGVSLEEWKKAMLEKGVARVGSGAQAATEDMAEFMKEFFPVLASVTEATRKMPDITLEDKINRMVNQVRGISKFKRS